MGQPVSTEQVSVRELEAYWDFLENLKPGEKAAYLETFQMLAWEEICKLLKWDLYTVAGGAFSKKHHAYSGVYRLIGLEADGDLKSPATIQRACGRDSSGTLYIGSAGWLDLRLNQLRRSFGFEGSHNAASRLQDCARLNTKFPYKRLGLALFCTSTKESARGVERDLIRAYLKSFGDTPPLNCSY